MTEFMQFADKTKGVCMYITSGLLVIALASFTKGILGNITSKIVKLSGIIILGAAAYAFGKELKDFLTDKPDILTNPKYSEFKKNTLMSCAVCIILLVTIIYSLYSLLF